MVEKQSGRNLEPTDSAGSPLGSNGLELNDSVPNQPVKISDAVRRTSEAAGLADWREPATGKVPKAFGDKAAEDWFEGDGNSWDDIVGAKVWDGDDSSDATTAPQSRKVETSGTRDPLADLTSPAINEHPKRRSTEVPPSASPVESAPSLERIQHSSESKPIESPAEAIKPEHEALKVSVAEVPVVAGKSMKTMGEALSLANKPLSSSSGDLGNSAEVPKVSGIDIPPTVVSVDEPTTSQPKRRTLRHRTDPLRRPAALEIDSQEPSLSGGHPHSSADQPGLVSSDQPPKRSNITEQLKSIGIEPPPDLDLSNSEPEDDFWPAYEPERAIKPSVFDLPPSDHTLQPPSSFGDSTSPQATSQIDRDQAPPSPSTDSASLDQSAELHVGTLGAANEQPLGYRNQIEPDRQQNEMEVSKGRNLPQAILVGLVLGGLSAVALWFGPISTTLLIAGLAGLAVTEFYLAMRKAGLRPAALLGIVGTISVQAAIFAQGADAYPLVLALTVVFGVLWYLAGADDDRPVLNLGLTMVGLLWVGGLAGFGVLITTAPQGLNLLLAAIVFTVLFDVAAYAGGRLYGSTAFHTASPNKTWEGTMTGFGVVVLTALGTGMFDVFPIFEGNLLSLVTLGVVVGVLAPIGDLAESMVKRDLGMKDMGTVLPGHGGVMDRVDGLLFVLPGAYYVGLLFGLF